MSANHIQKTLIELKGKLDNKFRVEKDIIDLDDEYMYEQLEASHEEDSEQHF